ncbi:MAG: hypothetical protein KF861_17465 [Planctomycetaceae bacterium]|nr:hypothetical protein [Planctomycetaceae bacterium]
MAQEEQAQEDFVQEVPGTESTESAEAYPPRGNAEFIGKVTTAAATQIFEMYNPHSPEALRALKDMGFTQVILDWPNLHADATAIGLNVVLANWWTDQTSQEEIDRALAVAREVRPDRLAGISVMDEPDRNSPDTPFGYYVDLYETLRPRLDSQLAGVPLEISHWGPLARWDQRYYDYFSFLYEAADVMRIMPFPDLHEGPLSEVYLMMLRSREVMKIAERDLPLVVILQAWVLPPESKLPELAELRVMAWQAVLGGAHAVSFFDYNQDVWNQTPGFHEGFVGLMSELTNLSRRLQGAVITSSMDDAGLLRATAVWPDGREQSITINTNREPAGSMQGLAIVESTVTSPQRVACQPRCCKQQLACHRPARHERRCAVRRCVMPCRGRLVRSVR